MLTSISYARRARRILIQTVFVILLSATALLLEGCASFNSNMGSLPDRTSAPPYADDPEANGNPAKAWYN